MDNILGIGFSELIFIFLIAVIILGPRRLPEMAAKAGKFIRDLRNMSQGITTEWQRQVAVAARLDVLEEAKQEIQQMIQPLQQTTSSSYPSLNKKDEQKRTIAPPNAPQINPAKKSSSE